MAGRHPERPAASQAIPESVTPSAGAFDFQEPPAKSVLAARRRRRSPLWQTVALWVGALAMLAAIGFGGWKAVQRSGLKDTLALQTPGAQTINEESSLSIRIGVAMQGVSLRELTYSLVEPPAGATIDAETGEFFWRPSEEQGPGRFTITVRAEAAVSPPVVDERQFFVTVEEVAQTPAIEPIDDQLIEGASPVSFVVKASDRDLPSSPLTYSLEAGAPPGATIDAESGRFEWTPGDARPGDYPVTVRVQKAGDADLAATQAFTLHIAVPDGPQKLIDQLATDLRKEGLLVSVRGREPLPGIDGDPLVLSAGGAEIILLPFDSDEQASVAAAQIPPDATTLLGDQPADASPLRVYRDDRLLALYQGDDQAILATLAADFGRPFTTVDALQGQPVPPPTPEDVQTLLGLLEKKLLFKTSRYPEIRKIFADRFAEEFDSQIRSAFSEFGEGYDEMQAWLDAHQNLRQELFTAIDPQYDDIQGALELFKRLKETFPKQIENYGELAIAVAVTWDRERGAIYEYTGHANRTQSNYSGELLDGAGNFNYLVSAEAQMQGRAQYLPYEFLVHLVNHRTPAAERIWALKSYGSRRAMFGECYSDVPYDDVMLETESRVCKLNGKDYVLPNLLRFGGVCAMQADFAARVGKSIGVPAAYVGGESIYGDSHAWVMWVELKNVTRSSIAFSLESHGRYRGDKYYVGDLRDPQTGQKISDRDLELRLHNAGINPVAARQAELVMRAYPLLREAADMSRGDRILFLNNVIDLSPGNEQAWRALAAIAGEGPLDKPDERLMLASFDRLFRTFANFPDFTWKVFGDLVSFVEDDRRRDQLYERLVLLYEAAGRPDLACEARLSLTDHLLDAERTAEAITGLAYTIKKFPDEGRYVPRMLDKLETICAEFPELNEHVVRFYTEFLPAIPRTRGGRPSKYCVEMYERAIALFRANDQPQLAAVLTAELTKIQSSR